MKQSNKSNMQWNTDVVSEIRLYQHSRSSDLRAFLIKFRSRLSSICYGTVAYLEKSEKIPAFFPFSTKFTRSVRNSVDVYRRYNLLQKRRQIRIVVIGWIRTICLSSVDMFSNVSGTNPFQSNRPLPEPMLRSSSKNYILGCESIRGR